MNFELFSGVEKHFQRMRGYKTQHENRKRSSELNEVVLQLSKTVFLLGNTLRCKQ
jgi:hypothetical protein